MDPKFIKLSEWELTGGGGSGDSFFHKSKPGILLKLYLASKKPELAVEEFLRSKKVHDMGIPCPETYDFITDGKRIGITFERMQDKISFASCLAQDPSKMDELAAEFAKMAHLLHGTPCDQDLFRSQRDIYIEHFNKGNYLPEVKAKLLKLAEELSPARTCLHGDFHFGNAILSGGKSYFIDLGDFAYGDPIIDLVEFFMICFVAGEDNCRKNYHMERPLAQAFFTRFLCYYYGISTKEEIEGKMRLMRRFVPLQIAHMAEGRTSDEYWAEIQKGLVRMLD